jgi:hypothetical protein
MKILNNNIKTPPTSLYPFAVGLALVVAFLLLIPLIAMQLGDEVNWSLSDFVTAWFLLFGAGITYKLAAGRMVNIIYRAAVGIAVATALFLVWSNLAVGLIGSENNPANLMYLGVLAVLVIASIIARFKPYRMALALSATALAQIVVTVIAVIGDLGFPENTAVQLLFINGFFITLWVGSALLFLYTSRKYPSSGN